MPSIKCTAKLAKRAGLKLELATENSADDWHANVFTFDRRFYVIFVHDESRLTCLAGPVLKRDLEDLESLLSRSLQTVLLHEGFSDIALQHALSKIQAMRYCKTNNRSVLGTINDNIFHVDHHLWHAGGIGNTNLATLAAHVNRMPMSPIKWNHAIEEYRRSVIHTAA